MDSLWVLWLALAYLSGSVPFALLIGLAKGVDIRAHGSGNVGATNVGRVLGRRWGVLCFVLDVLKGVLPVAVGGLALGYFGDGDLSEAAAWRWLALAAAAMLGHVFPVWLRFKGGKGVATGLGVLLAMWPLLTVPAAAAALTWVALAKAYRYVSLASMAAAALLPVYVAAWALGTGQGRGALLPTLVVTSLLGGLVLLRHRTNIARLRAGTESRIGAARRGE